MSQALPEKFPQTGINQLADGDTAFTAAQWPAAVDFVQQQITARREAAMQGTTQTELSSQQLSVMHGLAIPAIVDTLSEVMGQDVRENNRGTTFLALLTPDSFAHYLRKPSEHLAGVYLPDHNQVTINATNRMLDTPKEIGSFAKVFIHEYFHYLSNQFSELDRTSNRVKILRIGMMAVGEDIREADEGELTWDFFKSFNEAITETLAIETYRKIDKDSVFRNPDGSLATAHETYHEYRALLDAVMHDAIRYQATGLSETELWHSVARSFLTGEVKPLMDLVRATYPGVSMKQIGLMTSAEDLPTPKDFVYINTPEGSKRVVSERYLERLRDRLNGKTPQDYRSDVVPPDPPKPPKAPPVVVYANQIHAYRNNKLAYLRLTASADGKYIDHTGRITNRDENGFIIHYDDSWSGEFFELLIDVGTRYRAGTLSAEEAGDVVDELLFDQRHISELSKGFEVFYVFKHQLLDPNTSTEEFNKVIAASQQRLKKRR